ncbi:hypothetical protein Vafri_20914 [Volvox africanus]|uniref:Protein kinase domain-containing protein n=2 Tax=Volvox africanus TaxID=51714 RepID=A0A8J4BR02_9CHLO|nr:hypothetical protein Vafri_20914 [Volvox africanus]
MANIKLRPLVVHDSASSQSGFNDACAQDSSPSVRVHCTLPTTARVKLAPAPPDTGASAAEDTGVSKLRSKLRRLLGAHSSSQGTSTQKATTPSQNAALRCSSTLSLNDRPANSANCSRTTASVPVSPSVSGPNGPRARFLGTGVVVPTSTSSTPPATPGSGSASPVIQGTRAIPVPPPAGPSVNPPRCPSANSSRGLTLRRAVSFSPTATTFPPLGSPNVPSPPTVPPPNNNSSCGVAGAGLGGGSRTLSASSSFAAGAGRMSNMVVVPEDEALPEDPVGGDYCLPVSPGSIVGPPRPGQIAEYVVQNGYANPADPDFPPGVTALPPQPHYDGVPYPYVINPTIGGSSGGGPAAQQLSPTRPSPSGQDSHNRAQRLSSSSSSSTVIITSSNGYVDTGTPGPAVCGSAGLTSWSSDISVHHGPFQTAAVAAAVAVLEASPPPPMSPHLRSMPLKPTRASADSGRPLSSSSSTAGSSAAVGTTAASPRAGGSYHHPPSTATSGAPAVISPHTATASHTHNSSAISPQLSSPNPMAPPLTRGMSAFSLMPANNVGSSGRSMASTSSPWNATVAAAGCVVHPVAVPEGPPTPTQQPAIVTDARNVTPSSPKQQALRRTHSTIDNTTRTQQEGPSGPPGVLMALGASLPAEMKRKDWRIEDFTMLKRLYKGNYSAVHKALCRLSMRLVVIKTYDTTRMTELARNHVKREASLHAPLEHENILNLYAVFSQGPYVMLVEEVAEGGDLYHVLKSIPGHRLQEDRAVAGVLVPLLRALAYLHEQGICHRDIKLENILFSDRQHTRMLLADFGIALSLRHERAVTRAGTTEYMSPEQLRCPFKRHPSDNKDRTDLHYGLGVDVWATGVLAYELLHGYPPFLGSHREETEQLILTAEVQVAPQLSHGARDFVLSCLNKDPADRPTVMQLLQHTWVRQHMRPFR